MDGEDGRILILAEPLDGKVIASVVARMGLRATLLDDVHDACAAIGPDVLALLVTEELVDADAHVLGDCISTQPGWSDLPVVVMTSRRVHRTAAARQLLFDRLGHITLLQRPLRLESLTNAIAAAVRTRRRQYELRGRIEELASSAARLEVQVVERTRTLEQALARLHEAQRTLLQSQRLEAVGQMTGGVAHDFNNLLQVIVTSTELARRFADKPAALQKSLDTIRHAAQRGSQLTKQLLAFASRQPLIPRTVELERQLHGLRELLQRSLPPRILVWTTSSSDLWPVLIDAAQLEVAVLNLVVNAGDAIEGSGSVVVRAYNERLPSSAESMPAAAVALPPGDYVCVEVADTGSGMSDEVAARVFEPFFTTKQPGKGTGLGLSQVYGFVRQTGGTIAVRSTSPQGTVVALWLPRAPHVDAAITGSVVIADSAGTSLSPDAALVAPRSLKVLIVEDDPAVAAAVSEMIRAFGHDIRLARSADEALAGPLDEVELVFSDVIMPGRMDGVDLGLHLRELLPDLPVLLTSGYAGAPERVVAAGLPLLSKPYTPAQWNGAVTVLLGSDPTGSKSQFPGTSA